jgi:hypothetical protein
VLAPDSITTAEIRNGTIKGEDVTTVDTDALTGANVKDGTLTQDDLAPDAVASSEIADGTITADDLAGGSVTTDKQKANTALSLLANPPLLVVPATPSVVTDSSASATISIAGGSHVVLVMGQAQVVGTPAGTDVMTVSVQLFEGATPISAEYRDQITATDPTLTLPVWAMVPSAALPPASPGAHTYTLRLTASSTSAAPSTVTVTNAQVSAIDLGRS